MSLHAFLIVIFYPSNFYRKPFSPLVCNEWGLLAPCFQHLLLAKQQTFGILPSFSSESGFYRILEFVRLSPIVTCPFFHPIRLNQDFIGF